MVEGTRVPGQSILIIEDEIEVSEFYAAVFESQHAEIATAIDAKTALILAETKAFDLIICDLKLDGVSGVAVIRDIRRSAINRNTPIAVISVLSSLSFSARL